MEPNTPRRLPHLVVRVNWLAVAIGGLASVPLWFLFWGFVYSVHG